MIDRNENKPVREKKKQKGNIIQPLPFPFPSKKKEKEMEAERSKIRVEECQ